MAASNKPVERIKLKRKDGEKGKGTNRDGEGYEALHVEFGTVWQNERGKSVTLAKDFAITYKGKPIADSFINVFAADDKGSPKGGSRDSDPDDDF